MIFSLSFNFEFDQFLTYSQQLVISPYQHTHTHTQPQLYTDRKKTFFFLILRHPHGTIQNILSNGLIKSIITNQLANQIYQLVTHQPIRRQY